jgi:hypothetical protein
MGGLVTVVPQVPYRGVLFLVTQLNRGRVQNLSTVRPCGATKKRLGCALAIFSVPGPPQPRLAFGGAFSEGGLYRTAFQLLLADGA